MHEQAADKSRDPLERHGDLRVQPEQEARRPDGPQKAPDFAVAWSLSAGHSGKIPPLSPAPGRTGAKMTVVGSYERSKEG